MNKLNISAKIFIIILSLVALSMTNFNDAKAGVLSLKIRYESANLFTKSTTVELRNATTYVLLEPAITAVGGGNVFNNFSFTTGNATLFYIVVKSDNSLETWSSGTVQFTTGAVSYDFTINLNYAYGDNQILSAGIPSIYEGDINQDGFINLVDIVTIHGDASIFAIGQNSDLNEDGITNLADLILAYNNSQKFVSVISP